MGKLKENYSEKRSQNNQQFIFSVAKMGRPKRHETTSNNTNRNIYQQSRSEKYLIIISYKEGFRQLLRIADNPDRAVYLTQGQF